MKRIGLVGRGVVGDRITRRLPAVVSGIDLVVLAHEGDHADTAAEFIRSGVGVVSIADAVTDVRALCDLDDDARAADVALVVGAGMTPGLGGLLARHLASEMSTCDELHLALHGTAGPACARAHHRARWEAT